MAKPAANSVEGKAKPFLDRIENVDKELESLRGTYMANCKALQEDRREIYIEAKSAGVPPKALKGVVKRRRLEAKLDAIDAGFDEDEAAAYEAICESLGPLGEAAASRAGYARESKAGATKSDEKGGDDSKEDEPAKPLKHSERKKSLQANEAKAKAMADEALGRVGRGPDAKSAAIDSLTEPTPPAAA